MAFDDVARMLARRQPSAQPATQPAAQMGVEATAQAGAQTAAPRNAGFDAMARRLATRPKAAPVAQPVQAAKTNEYDPTEGMSMIDKALVGAGRGFVDFGEGVKQLYLKGGEAIGAFEEGTEDEYVKSTREDRDLFEKHLGDSTAASVGRVVGNTAPLAIAPVGAGASAGARVGTSVLAGAGAGATQLVDEERGDSRLQNTLIGAALGAAGGAAAEGLAKGAQKVVAGAKSRKAATLTPEQQTRLTDAEALGIQPTTGQVSRKFDDQQFETEAAKHIGNDTAPLRQTLQQQNTALHDEFARLGAGDSVQAASERIVGSVKELDAKYKADVDAAYRSVREQLPQGPVMQPRTLADTLEEALDEVATTPQIDAIMKRAERLAANQGVMSMNGAEKLRRFIGGKMDGATPDQKRVLKQIQQSLDDDVNRTAQELGVQGFGEARAVAAKRYEILAGKDSAPIAEAILSGKVAEEAVVTKLMSQATKARDVRRLSKTLNDLDPKGAQDLRSGVITWLRDQSRLGQQINEAGDSVISGAKMASALERIGEAKLKAIFTPKEIQAINRLSRVAQMTTGKVQGAVNTSNTSSALLNRTARLLENIPGARTLFAPILGSLRAVGVGMESNAMKRGVEKALNPRQALKKANREAERKTLLEAMRSQPKSLRQPVLIGGGAANADVSG